MKYYSHPNKFLLDHLKETRDINIDKISQDLKNALEITSLSHDFGKYTSFFQNHLKGIEKTDFSNHSFISGIFGAFVAFSRLGEDSYLPLIIYNTILHHHGNLEGFSKNLPGKIKIKNSTDYSLNLLIKIDIANQQILDIKENYESILKDMILLNLDKEFKEFINLEDPIVYLLAKLKKIEFRFTRDKDQEKYYFIHQSLYSALISADKLSASGIVYESSIYPDLKDLKKIKDEKFPREKKGINLIRQNIFEDVMKNVKENYKKSSIFSITAPTGTGKTYTGFYAALKLKELLNLNGKIIYTLPFTSIIEQNFSSLVDILKEVDGYKDEPSRFILKHHNLSKTDYVAGDQEYTKSQAEMLTENWESGVIVTTFVQVFETIIGHRNRMLKKFIAFKDSVLLIDEIQSIDIEYYNLIQYTLEKISEYMNCKIIIMTATKPMILENAFELLPDNKSYFNDFNRTQIIPRLNNISISEFIDEFIKNLEEKSYLIVCNTINQSLDIYNYLNDLDREIFYLSTNILPLDRNKRIKEISKKLKDDKNIILVSTQVVEAGVDMDFDQVIRDLAPLDSIIQCAGRCNRNHRKSRGNVIVTKMANEKGDLFGKYIYGNTLLNLTNNLLENKNIIEEKDYFSLINEYYVQVIKNKSQQKSEDYIKSIKNLNFTIDEGGINDFSLIKNNPMNEDVVFIYDDIAEEAYEEFKEIFKIKNYGEKREKYLEIRQILKNYTLSLPNKYFRRFIKENEMLLMPREGIEQFYDPDTGFIREDKDEVLIF